MSKYQIGWGKGDITPKGEPVSLVGQFHVRITEEIHDPLYAMCMVVKSEEAASVWVSIDACWVFKISCPYSHRPFSELHRRLALADRRRNRRARRHDRRNLSQAACRRRS